MPYPEFCFLYKATEKKTQPKAPVFEIKGHVKQAL